MNREGDTLLSFNYHAQTYAGLPMRGSLEAPDVDAAQRQLIAMGLRVLEISPASQPASAVRLGAADLQTFNEYLVQISTAGLPIEQGLRALSKELKSGRLKAALDALVADLERGLPIEQAVANHRESFPPLYGRLLDAGIQSANLPAVLHRFGRHMETVAELRDAMWRACAYPIIVLLALALLLTFLGYFVLPTYFATLQGFSRTEAWRFVPGQGLVTERNMVQIPWVAMLLLYLGRATPWIIGGLVVLFAGSWFVYRLLRLSGHERGWLDGVVYNLPIVGPALRANATASWLHVVSIGTAAGLDLPRALHLAGEAVGLPSLQNDGEAIATELAQGRPTENAKLTRLPATVPMAIDLAHRADQLPQTFAAMATQYREQAERRIRLIPSRVLPPLLILIGLISGGILFSLWLPLSRLFQGLTGA